MESESCTPTKNVKKYRLETDMENILKHAAS